jgi:hypothetical protein
MTLNIGQSDPNVKENEAETKANHHRSGQMMQSKSDGTFSKLPVHFAPDLLRSAADTRGVDV